MEGAMDGAMAAAASGVGAAPASFVASSFSTAHGARKSTKSWIQDHSDIEVLARGAAGQLTPEQEAAQRTVNCVTRFATVMCVIIACVKVGVYLYVKAAVVKTSALDSMGDLIANIITMYTGYKMANIDRKMFPVGQSRFEPIGVLIFSTLMAAMMFGNALSNVEQLSAIAEKERADAVKDFWTGLFGRANYDIHEKRIPSLDGKMAGKDLWEQPEKGLSSFLSLVASACSSNSAEQCLDQYFTTNATRACAMYQFLRSTGDSIDPTFHGFGTDKHGETELLPEGGVISKLIPKAADTLDENKEEGKLLFQNAFLGCCMTYKFFLWLSCVCIFIPRTGSTVLQALANDKRNDFIGTFFVITSTFAAFYGKRAEYIPAWIADKMDSGASLILSCVIIYTWVCLMQDQIFALSCPAVEEDLLEPLKAEVRAVTKTEQFESKVVAYYSSAKQTVEVDLTVLDSGTRFNAVQEQMQVIKGKVESLGDMERCIVVPK